MITVKSTIFFCVLFQTIFGFSAIAQDFKTLYDSTTACIRRNDAESAMLHINSAHHALHSQSGSVDENLIGILLHEMNILNRFDTKDSAFARGRLALQLAETHLGDTSLVTIRCLHRLAFCLSLYSYTGTESIALYSRGWRLITARFSEVDTLYAESLVRFGMDYAAFLAVSDRWKESEAIYQTSMDVAEQHVSTCSSLLPELYFRVLDVYKEQGNNSLAEYYALRSVEACKDIGCHRMYWFRTYLGEVMHAQKRYQEAERNYLEALSEAEMKHGPNHIEITTALNNLGVLYRDLGRYVESEEFLRRSYVIRLAKDNPLDVELARSMSNLGAVYLAMGMFDKAEPLLRRAMNTRIHCYGPTNSLVARSMNVYAQLMFLQGKYDSAETYFQNALAIAKRTLHPYHPLIGNYADQLALLYANTNRWDDAAPLWKSAREIYFLNLTENFPSLSEKGKAQYLETIKSNFERYCSWYLTLLDENPSLTSEMYDNHVATKSIILRATRDFRTNIETSPDSTLKAMYVDWLSTKARSVLLYHNHASEGNENDVCLDSLEHHLNTMEQELARRSQCETMKHSLYTHHWKDVRARLAADEAAVELIRFRRFDKRWTDTIFYAALIVTERSLKHPEIVLLRNGNDLETGLYEEYLATMLPSHEANKGMSMKHFRATLPQRLSHLYEHYWAPIQSQLKGIRRVYVSSDGIYHKINLNTLMTPSGTYILDTLDIHWVSNTNDIARKRPVEIQTNNRSALVFARPDYDLADWMKGNTEQRQSKSTYLLTDGSIRRDGEAFWRDLQYTEDEGLAVKSILEECSWNTELYSGTAAVEGVLRQTPSPTLIHIATHGFFLRDTSDLTDIFPLASDPTINRNPLLKSGLVFAGANTAVTGLSDKDKPTDTDVRDDGILLAEEVSLLRLEETELVVLSACETASGDIRNGEGVYGLQRSFLLAGATAIMMSLWSIEDNATFSLMKGFYKSFAKTLDARYSLRESQRRMVRQGALPCDWGAFVILSR